MGKRCPWCGTYLPAFYVGESYSTERPGGKKICAQGYARANATRHIVACERKVRQALFVLLSGRSFR